MITKIFWKYTIPIMLHVPILNKLAMRLLIKQLTKVVRDSIGNYSKVLDMMKTSELKDNPYFQIACALSAVTALMPAAMIYYCMKTAKAELERLNEKPIG